MSVLDPPVNKRSIRGTTSRRVVYDLQHAPWEDELEHVHRNFRTPLDETNPRLSQMLHWTDNWDGEGSAKPNWRSILEARHWISRMRADATQAGGGWIEPQTLPDENGDVAFEWWNDGRNLIVYVSPDSIYALQTWGPDIESQMMDGEVEGSEDNKKIWLWLMG